jgi:hypothetical protein
MAEIEQGPDVNVRRTRATEGRTAMEQHVIDAGLSATGAQETNGTGLISGHVLVTGVPQPHQSDMRAGGPPIINPATTVRRTAITAAISRHGIGGYQR